MVLRFRSSFRSVPAVLAAVLAVSPALSGQATARRATAPSGNGNAPVSSGEIVTGLAKPNNPRSKVSPTQPAPAHHVVQPSDKLKSDPNVKKEQVAPVPDKPVPPGTVRGNNADPHG